MPYMYIRYNHVVYQCYVVTVCPQTGDVEVVVRMTQLQAAFYILAAGLTMSGLVFSGEVMLDRYGTSRLRKHRRI